MTYQNIVSANYRDRSHIDHWLLRGFKEKPEKAVAYRAVTAKGIVFCSSTQFESGFGCSVVGWCESAVGHTKDPALPKNAVRIKFSGSSFYRADSNEDVPRCDRLILLSDGSMYAVLASAKKAA